MLSTQSLCPKQKLGNLLVNNILKNNLISCQSQSSTFSTLSKQNLKLSTKSLQYQENRNLIQNGLNRESALIDLIQKNNYSVKSKKWEMDYDAAANYWIEREKTYVHMEKGELLKKIETYIKSHNTCQLATGYGDMIRNTSIEYNYVDGCFYFFSEGGLKFKGLKENKNVGISIWEPFVSFSAIQSLQVSGTASMIEPFTDEYIKLLEHKKIPVEMMKKHSPALNLIKVVVKSYDYINTGLKKEGFSNRQHLDLKEVKNEPKSTSNWKMDYDAAINYWVEKDRNTKHVKESVLKEKIENYLKSHNTCSFATGSRNIVRNTPIEYNYVDGYIYIFSEGGLKFRALKENKNVSLSICEPYTGFSSIKSVQAHGVASMVEPLCDEYMKASRARKIPEDMAKKNPLNLIKVAVKSYDYLDSDFKKEGYGNRQHIKGWTPLN